MGQIKSILNRKKTPDELRDQLELLRNDMTTIQSDILSTKRAYLRAVKALKVSYKYISILFIIFIYTFFMHISQHWWYLLIIILTFIILLVAVYFVVTKYYEWVLREYKQKLNKSKEDSEDILEEVRTTETYVIAKDILDEYSSGVNTTSNPSTSY